MADKFEIDGLKMYLGYDYQVTDSIIIHQPTIAEIAEFGEQRYYSTVFLLTCIPSDMKFQLDDLGFNYMDVSDYDLFVFLTRTLKQEDTSILLGDLDLSKMEIAKDEVTDDVALVDVARGIKIDKVIYTKMVNYLRKIHDIRPKIEKAQNEETRKLLIQLDREKATRAAKKPYESQLKPIISALMRVPSCTLSFSEIKGMPIYAVMDTLMGAQVFTATNALLIGSYSGMVDTSKISKKEFDWMRSIGEASKHQVISESGQSVKTT